MSRRETAPLLGLVVPVLLAVAGCSKPTSAPSALAVPGAAQASSGRAAAGAASVGTPSTLPSPAPSVPPISNGTCPVGHGDVNAVPAKAPSQFVSQVEAAVAQLLRDRPALFNLERQTGEGQFYVNDSDLVNAEVVQRLQALGLCAYFDFTRQLVQVKTSDSSSEDFQVVSEKSFLRRGEAGHVSTWTPASFPLSAADVIAYVRVGFYSIYCDDGVPIPGNVFAQLPMGCYGIVTATPKKADASDVDSRIHGPEISWEVRQSGDWIELRDYPDQSFNKYVKGLDPGEFTICATVQGKQGCLNGDVIVR